MTCLKCAACLPPDPDGYCKKKICLLHFGSSGYGRAAEISLHDAFSGMVNWIKASQVQIHGKQQGPKLVRKSLIPSNGCDEKVSLCHFLLISNGPKRKKNIAKGALRKPKEHIQYQSAACIQNWS